MSSFWRRSRGAHAAAPRPGPQRPSGAAEKTVVTGPATDEIPVAAAGASRPSRAQRRAQREQAAAAAEYAARIARAQRRFAQASSGLAVSEEDEGPPG